MLIHAAKWCSENGQALQLNAIERGMSAAEINLLLAFRTKTLDCICVHGYWLR